MKLWGGRFTKDTDTLTNDFNSSIRFDSRLYAQDIRGSIAHVTMLCSQGILTAEEKEVLEKGLLELLEEIKEGKVAFDINAEDIHMNVEKLLIERLGDVAKKIHTGRSRNDQVALDMRLYVREEIDTLKKMLKELMITLLDMAKGHQATFMPGYTHLQRAQPITFSHHLMAYFEMFKRDYQKLDFTQQMLNQSPLGCGALATTTYPLDRKLTAELLGFDGICQNSIDGVSDRDFCIDTAYNIAMVMMHLSRFSEEIILWNSHEFGFITLDDAYSTGSSIMPQKKNPDIAELVRGKSGRSYGNLMGLLTTMKGLSLAYNKDMQEDKEALFDSIDTLRMCLPIFTNMLATLQVNKEKMYQAVSKGFTNATDAADYLVKKGMPFRDAHRVIGELVLYCTQQSKGLEELTLNEYQAISELFEQDLYEAITIEACVTGRNVAGGPSEEAVSAHIKMAEAFLEIN